MHSICLSAEMYRRSGAAEEEVWWGFSVFVTTVRWERRFPASGCVLMPAHYHLPEIRTRWVCRVEQEEIKRGGRGEVWGWKQEEEEEEVWIGSEREEERCALELILCFVQLTLFSFFTLSNCFTTKKGACDPTSPTLHPYTFLLLVKLLWYLDLEKTWAKCRWLSVGINQTSLKLCLWCLVPVASSNNVRKGIFLIIKVNLMNK